MNQKSALKKIKNTKFLKVCETTEFRNETLENPGRFDWHLSQWQGIYGRFGVTSLENPLPVTADTLFQTVPLARPSPARSSCGW